MRLARRWILPSLLLLLATGLRSFAGAPQPTSRPLALAAGRLSGINAQFMPPPTDPAGRTTAWRRITDLGVRVSRVDGDWAAIEKQPGVYDWRPLDAKVDELAAHGLSPLVILDYGNPLYSKLGSAAASTGFGGIPPFAIGYPGYYPPDSPTPFATWAGALARRYRGRVSLFEVWNEENLGWRFWEPHEDPAAYAALLKQTYTAVKAVAPEDQVAFGGTFYPAVDAATAAADGIPVPTSTATADLALPHQGTLEFVANALAAAPDLGGFFDAVAYHPYHFPYMAPEVDIPIEGSTETSMTALQTLLATHHLAAKPVWITEVGWPNNTLAYGATPMKSASYLVRTYATAWAHGIEQVDWYCYGDASDWQYNQESAFGVVDSDGNLKPAYYAWQALDRLVMPLPFLDSRALALGLPADGHALRFGDAVRSVTVVWLAPETMFTDQGPVLPVADQRATVPTPAGSTALYDMLGRPLPLGATFQASPYPVFLVQGAAVAPSPAVGGLPNTSR